MPADWNSDDCPATLSVDQRQTTNDNHSGLESPFHEIAWVCSRDYDDGLQAGVIVRVFRFNCPRICPRVDRNIRFSWGFWALAHVYGTDALSKRICLSQFGLVVATKILERRRIRAQVAQTGVLLRDVFKILDGPIGVPD